MSRTSNLYPDTYMLTVTCCRIQVARSGYMLAVSRRHNYYSFMSRSTCIPFLYPADGRQTGNNFVADIQETCWRQQVDTTCVRQHVSWCKRGLRCYATAYDQLTSVVRVDLKHLLQVVAVHFRLCVSGFCSLIPLALFFCHLSTIWHFCDYRSEMFLVRNLTEKVQIQILK